MKVHVHMYRQEMSNSLISYTHKLSLSLFLTLPHLPQDDIATTLVRILQREGKAREFICDVIMAEVQAVGEAHHIQLCMYEQE